jgi:hypothetical protein
MRWASSSPLSSAVQVRGDSLGRRASSRRFSPNCADRHGYRASSLHRPAPRWGGVGARSQRRCWPTPMPRLLRERAEMAQQLIASTTSQALELAQAGGGYDLQPRAVGGARRLRRGQYRGRNSGNRLDDRPRCGGARWCRRRVHRGNLRCRDRDPRHQPRRSRQRPRPGSH